MLWSDFQKPKKLDYDAETLTPNYGRFVAQPANQHLAVARLRSPRATRQWMARVTEVDDPPA